MTQSHDTNPIKPLSSYRAGGAYIFTLFHLKVLKKAAVFIGVVLKDFFFLQYGRRLRLSKIPIINVDNVLDDAVPFKPEKIDTYLDFVNLWIRPLVFLSKRLKHGAVPYYCEFIELITKCYEQAGEFYRFRMSTTKRPKGKTNIQMVFVHLVDPHYLCVPSLHVSIMALVITYYKKAFAQAGLTEQEQDAYNKELYESAIEIAETVLYVKQHSVNCIAAALYMMCFILKDQFTIQDAVDFINNMFQTNTDISEKDKKAINEHINDLFEELLLEGANEYEWITPLKRWIIRYYEENGENC